MRLIDADTARHHLPFPALIDALRAAFVAGAEVPLRHTHTVGAAGGGAAGGILIMPAWRSGGRLGIKTVTIFPGNGERGLPGLHSVYTLYDAATGVPLAQIDGNEITTRRTAAAAALAASMLAREDASRLLVLGSGRVASLLPQAFTVVRPIREVRVWNHRPASAEALAARWRVTGADAQAVRDLDAAVAWADIVSCATLSDRALVKGALLRPGTHLDLIGSFSPAMREADADCFARSAVYVDTEEALAKSGDVLSAIAEGGFAAESLRGTLADLCRGKRGGRQDAGQITLFKAVGSALEDLAAAEQVFDALDAPPSGPASER